MLVEQIDKYSCEYKLKSRVSKNVVPSALALSVGVGKQTS